MANPTTNNDKDQPKAIAKQNGKTATFGDLVLKYRDEFAKVAPKHLNIERVFRIAESARARNPYIAKCTLPSMLKCLMEGTEQGLEPVGNTPEQFATMIQGETRKWGDIVRRAGIKVAQ